MDRLKTNIVPPDGPLDSPICFIGQAPGAEEDSSLRPFVGEAGRLLNRCLKSSGLVRSQVLINNVFAQRPPRNHVKYFFDRYLNKLTPEGQEHVDRLEKWLQNLLERRQKGGLGPNLLVALGVEALWVLTGHKRITKWRGSILPCTLVEGFKVYPMFHPSYVSRLMQEPREALQGEQKRRKQNALPLFLWDLERVKFQMKFPEIKRLEREFLIDPAFNEVMANLEIWNTGKFDQIAIDIETMRGRDNTVVWCVGLSPHPQHAMVIPFIKGGQHHWPPEEEAKIWESLSKLFLNSKVSKIFQNGGYDLSILGRYYGLRVSTGSYEDTMWCHQATFPQLDKGLHVLTSIYTWEPYYKDDGKYWDGRRISDEAEFTYNARDCCVTREIWPQVKRTAKEKGTWKAYQNSMKVMPSLLSKMVRGVAFDKEAQLKLGHDFEFKCKDCEEVIQTIEGDYPKTQEPYNLNSSGQMQYLIYGRYGLPVQYNLKTKKPSLDKDARTKLLKKVKPNSDAEKVIKAFDDFKKFSKLSNTYTNMEIEGDERVRTNYGFVSTFRLNSSQSHFGGGGNLQNIPTRTEEGRLIRRLFVPDSRKVFLAADLEQAEAREVAWDAGDLELIEAFESGEIDVHWEVTKKIFKLPKTMVYEAGSTLNSPLIGERKMKFFRDIGKTGKHAFNYGMGPRMLQTILSRQEVNLEFKICRKILEDIRKASPFIETWHRKVRAQIETNRTLFNVFGDKREFRGRLGEDVWRAAYAWTPQSTVGRILEFAIQQIHEELDYFEPLLNVHDEVVGQLEERKIPRAVGDLTRIMEIPHEVGGRTLKIPVAFKWGLNWGEMEEI